MFNFFVADVVKSLDTVDRGILDFCAWSAWASVLVPEDVFCLSCWCEAEV